MQENQNDLFADLSFDNEAKQHIRSIASWAIVIVVVAVIGYILTLFQTFSGRIRPVRNTEGFNFGMNMGSSTATTVIGVIIGLLVNFFLFRFATQARNALNGLHQTELNSSFNSLKIYFMIGAILCIIIFLFILLAIVVAATGSIN